MAGDGDLGVVTGGSEFAVARIEGGVQLVGAFESCLEDGRAEAMGGAAGGVEDEQALGGEDAGVKISKGLGKCAPGR